MRRKMRWPGLWLVVPLYVSMMVFGLTGWGPFPAFPWFLLWLALGTALRVVVPYLRSYLESAAADPEGGLFAGLVFDWRYLYMFLAPILEFGVAFLTIDGLWQAAWGWQFIPTVMLAYSGTDLARETIRIVRAAAKALGPSSV